MKEIKIVLSEEDMNDLKSGQVLIKTHIPATTLEEIIKIVITHSGYWSFLN